LFNSTLFNATVFGGGAPPGLVVQAGNGLLYPALRKAAVTIGPGRTPSPAQFQDAIDELNRLIGSLNCDRLFIYGLDIQEFPLTAGQKSYTMGIDPSGGMTADFPAQRPQAITNANILWGSPVGRDPLAILTPEEWASIVMQDQPATIPSALYNDRAAPLSTIYLWGQPMEGCSLELFTWHLIPTFQTVSDVVLLPPGYEDALVLNLAVRLAPHFQRALDPNVREDARISLMRLMSLNAPRPIADTSGALGCGGGFNIYRGE
jgi:hypothetical protein